MPPETFSHGRVARRWIATTRTPCDYSRPVCIHMQLDLNSVECLLHTGEATVSRLLRRHGPLSLSGPPSVKPSSGLAGASFRSSGLFLPVCLARTLRNLGLWIRSLIARSSSLPEVIAIANERHAILPTIRDEQRQPWMNETRFAIFSTRPKSREAIRMAARCDPC